MFSIGRKHSAPSRAVLIAAAASLFAVSVSGQQNRIIGKINGEQRYTLTGHIHPNALPQDDQGRAAASLPLSYVTMILQPSASQAAALDRLLADQQNPTSPEYHKWLTPEQYAAEFGASQDDINKLVSWLQSQQLSVKRVARANNAIVFSGTAEHMGTAFGTEIHNYQVDGAMHYANSTEPTLPVALRGLVLSIRGLNDFRLKPRILHPNYTDSSSGNHYLAPDDFATIFHIQPLYSAGMNGAGQKIAIVGQSDIDTSHLSTFRSRFGLPATNLKTILIPGSSDPGTSSVDAQESDLDLEWSSAVARSSDLLFVYASDVMDAVQYTIDQNLAPVLSMSYGSCEALTSSSDAAAMQTWAKQANAEGMTWVASSGDSGAAGCYRSIIGPPWPSSNNSSLSTDLPASVPEVTAVGGTRLNEGSGAYWNSSNNGTTQASALSYIPETSWNDSTIGSLASSGGGASTLFSKPSWQTGTGVPNDGVRDVPDVALPASADHDGYMVYTSEGKQAGWYTIGGTSAGAPAFAGMLAILNQYLISNGYQSSSGLGNINPHVYAFSASTPAAFHDVTSGNNVVSTLNCTLFGGCSASTVGYAATSGYDQVTGLGSIDTYNFVTAWRTGAAAKVTPTLTYAAAPSTIATTGSTTLTATVSSTDAAKISGSVTFLAGTTQLGVSQLSGTSGSAAATLTIAGNSAGLSVGANTITATYNGDSLHNSATASTTLTVMNPSYSTPSISAAANSASYQQAFAPGMAMSIWGSQLALTTRSADSTPLPTTLDNVSVTIDGVAAPLYYISPAQLNVQIPYEVGANRTVSVVVSNNKQTASMNIKVSAAAPGILTGSDGSLSTGRTAARGQNVTLYFTGAGALQPSVSTGSTPDRGDTPVPVQATLITVGGQNASTTYIGEPSWSVGILQVNFTVPTAAGTGTQPVVVSVGGVASQTATLTITQ